MSVDVIHLFGPDVGILETGGDSAGEAGAVGFGSEDIVAVSGLSPAKNFDLVGRWRESVGSSAEIVNLYGPTETTLAKCWYSVPERPPAAQLPVGSPLPESQALVLSPERRLCDRLATKGATPQAQGRLRRSTGAFDQVFRAPRAAAVQTDST